MPGHRRGADIDGNPEGGVDEAWPDGHRNAVAIDRHRDRSVIVGRRLVGRAKHCCAPGLHGEVVGASDGLADQFGHRLGIAEHRPWHVDVEQCELRIDHQAGEIDRLAYDLFVDLALGWHGDDRVVEHDGRATEAAPFTQRAAGVALGLVVDFD